MGTFTRQDAALTKSKALPAAEASANTDAIDLNITDKADFTAPCEVVCELPALDGTALPAAKTVEYELQHATAADFSNATTLDKVGTQTGTAVTGGAAAVTVRKRLPSNVKRYIRLKATAGVDTLATAATMSMSLKF